MNPYPINREDIEDCNGETGEDFEESLDDHEILISILEKQENSCQLHSRTNQVSAFLPHVSDHRGINSTMAPEDRGSVDGFVEECSSPTRETNTALNEDQVNNSGSANGVAEECNSPTRDSIVALDRRHETGEVENGVFKARIPIARLRNALDDEDPSDRGGFRCAEC